MLKNAADDQTTNEGHPEDETTGGGQLATIVNPNPKCNGCLHYVLNRSMCTRALVPASCGDGSKPETGYAPMVTDALAYQEWRAKAGLAHNAPRSSAQANARGSGASGPAVSGGDGDSPDLVIQVLGDEGHMDLGKGFDAKKMRASLKKQKASEHDYFVKPGGKPRTPAGAKWRKLSAASKVKKGGTAPMPKLKAPGMKQGYAGEDVDSTKHVNIKPIDTHNPKRGAGPQATEQSKHADWSPGKTVVGAKVDANRSPILHEVRRRQMKNPSEASKYKAAQAGGGKVFSHSALAQHVGMKPEHIADLAHASQHVHDFHNKVRAEFGDKVKNLTSGQIRSAYHSTGLMHSLRNNDMSKGGLKHKMLKPSGMVHSTPLGSYSVKKQASAYGGSGTHAVRFHPKGLSQKHVGAGILLGEHPTLHEAHMQIRSHSAKTPKSIRTSSGTFAHNGKKWAVKSLVTADLDLIKAHKSGKRCVVGHTSTGKPIHSDAFGAEGYNEEEHREAEEIHRDIGDRLLNAAHGVGSYGPTSKLPHAARKYLGDIARKHSDIGRRHGRTAMDQSSARFAKQRAAESGYVEPQAFLSDAAKSFNVRLSNNPTDAEIAKAIASGGGGAALVSGGMIHRPLNVSTPLEGGMDLGLPVLANAVVEVKPEEEKPAPAPLITPGGVVGSALTLTFPRRN